MMYVAIDTETTGLDPDNEEIVEVCAIKFDDGGCVHDKFYSLCQPIKGYIPPEASNIHGITFAKVADQPFYMDIREKVASFIGDATVVGHNVIAFDIKFLKISPKAVEDTLLMCRKLFPGRNNLGAACKRMHVAFDSADAHGAEYDVTKTMELFLALKAYERKGLGKEMQTDIFTAQKTVATQAYSYSRINLFQQCPWKWYRVYVQKQKEESGPLRVGSCIHTIAQNSAMWCYARSFANRFSIYAKKTELKFPAAVGQALGLAIQQRQFYLPHDVKTVTTVDVGMFVYMNMGYCQSFFGITMTEMINKLSENVGADEFDKVDRPPAEVYTEIVQRALAKHKINEPEDLADLRFLSSFFYEQKDFLVIDGTISLVEKKMCFDKDWKLLQDFFSDSAFFRGVIDILEYNGPEMVTITDYKSSRKMLGVEQLKLDRQLMVYVMLVHMFLPQISTIRVRHHYMRFGKVVEVDITNVSQVAAEARAWIEGSIEEIEQCLAKGDPKQFQPTRNQFCGSCSYFENSKCLLFNITNINDIDDVANFEIKTPADLQQAFKKAEVCEAEKKTLEKKCKEYVVSHHRTAVVDGNAVLDFWTKEDRDYDGMAVAKLLLEKELKLSEFLPFYGMTKTGWAKIEKLLKKRDIELTQSELDSVSKVKRTSTFAALTPEEIKEDGYVNVTIDQPEAVGPDGPAKA